MAKDKVAALYELPLEEFTGARNALAKELTSGGDKAKAAEVRALRKPSVPAWAVNQVARAHPADIEALFDAGAQLRDAQKKLMRTGDASVVKDATVSERNAVKVLVGRARAILANAGHTPNESMLERVADTFYATTVDEEGRRLVKEGTLTKELKRVGFGDVGGLSVVPTPRAAKEQRDRASQLIEDVARLRKAADIAEKHAAEAEARAAELVKEAEAARAQADAARERARFARREATETRRDAERAARRVHREG
ncbi:MAG TPA: hypothetical protein VJ818_07930 [Actinomycetota bacterium]|nr:hypothetical protein [Actinomycetota bacterium]